jgi:hypothetical protein
MLAAVESDEKSYAFRSMQTKQRHMSGGEAAASAISAACTRRTSAVVPDEKNGWNFISPFRRLILPQER